MKMKTRRATAKSNELTHRERQILRLVCEGLSNKEIGRRLKITDGTVKVHLHNIFEKLQASNRTVLTAPRDKAGEQTDHE
jgi:two-component system nitrate/nitrite response regulator NarL